MPGKRTINRDRVAALIAKNLTDKQIAERLGCADESIQGIRRALSSAKRNSETDANAQRGSGSDGFAGDCDSGEGR